MIRLLKTHVLIILTFFSICSVSASTVRMETIFGNIDIQMHPEVAPITVQNFLNYVNDDDFDNSFFHRSIPNFIIQAGSFTIMNDQVFDVPVDDPIVNEFNLTNARGTIAMAKLSGDPDSATSGWFFNVVDNNTGEANEGNLDLQNGGFTVFGTVIAGMDVVDTIAALNTGEIPGFGSTFANVPLANGGTIADESSDLVVITDMIVLADEFQINSGLNGAWFNSETTGQGITIEILPESLKAFMAWFTFNTQETTNFTSAVGDEGQRWLTGFGDIDLENNTITMDLVSTSGGVFDDPTNPTNSEPGTIGSVTLGFTDCENATLTYTLIDSELMNTRELVRISPENVALCQTLSGQISTQTSNN